MKQKSALWSLNETCLTKVFFPQSLVDIQAHKVYMEAGHNWFLSQA